MGFSWVLICDSSCGVGYPERRMGFAGDRCASLPDGRSGQRSACDARYRPCCVVRPFCRADVPFRRAGASRTRGRRSGHGAHPVRQPHPPDAGRDAAGASRRRVFGNRCGSGQVRGAVRAAGWRISTASSAWRRSRRTKAGPCRWRRICCVPGTGPANGTAGAARRARRRPARVGLRPVHLGDDPYARRPPCEAVQAAGGNLIRRACRLRPGRSRPATRTPNPDARKRLSGHMHARAAHVVPPHGPAPPSSASPARRRPDTSKPPPAKPNGAPNRQCKSHKRIARVGLSILTA